MELYLLLTSNNYNCISVTYLIYILVQTLSSSNKNDYYIYDIYDNELFYVRYI